ncbi:BPSL0761 family protein [Burkholderia multivorans]|uniref:BPSL0761 family protein n=1 Tax=Burkholderia multivorans TaxID=87883 RepID=UPI003BF7BCC0
MTRPSEHTAAVLGTRAFLMELSRPSIGAIPRDVASVAERLLRHYPGLAEIGFT